MAAALIDALKTLDARTAESGALYNVELADSTDEPAAV